jgi:hypothetical protein
MSPQICAFVQLLYLQKKIRSDFVNVCYCLLHFISYQKALLRGVFVSLLTRNGSNILLALMAISLCVRTVLHKCILSNRRT